MDEAVRNLVRERAGNRCEYCHLPQEAYDLTFHIEHVVASQHRHDDDPSNLALACDRCNLHKGTNLASIDPQTGEVVPLFNPRTDAWEEHFALFGAEIIGQTPIGRATVRLLQMNSERRIILRKRLLAAGEM
jgi:5-methylcytosine-specific restriction endonuclease McrA